MRSPEERLYDPNASVREQARRELARMSTLREGALRSEAYSEPRNQIAEAGMGAMEMTGAPSFARGIQAIERSEPGAAIPEFLMGALSVSSLLPVAGAAPRAVFRRSAAEAPAARLPVNPTRMPTRASDGSVLPLREPEPFRNSMRGGSEDLADAARMQARDFRTEGFDVDAPLYRGHEGDPSTGHWRASEGMNGEGVYLTRDPASAERWARRQAQNAPTVHTVYSKGRIADSRDGLTYEEARAQGYSGLHYYENGRYIETVVFDPANVSPSIARRALPEGSSTKPKFQGRPR